MQIDKFDVYTSLYFWGVIVKSDAFIYNIIIIVNIINETYT